MGKSNKQLQHENILMLARLLKERREIEAAETSLRTFVKSAWSIVEPGTTYISNWHIDALCDHLEAVASRDIRKLLINISPRSGKSTIGCILFPAHVWVTKPETKFLYASYDLKLSMRDSRKCRSLVGSAWYQKNWADRFKILSNKGGQDTKQRFDNDKGGYRVSTSTDSGTVGEGGDILFYDDPNDIGQMNSDAYVESVIYFHEHVMASRLNDPKSGCRVCIQQRSNENDMTGYILSKESGWEHLVIPMEYEGSKKITSIGWFDPRQNQGDLMWPEKIGPSEVSDLKKNAIRWAGQYQQRPAPGEGAKFKRQWWKFYNPAGVKLEPVKLQVPGGTPIEKMPVTIPPAFERVVQAWDMAFKAESDSDFVAGHAWGSLGANVYLLARDTKRRDFPDTLRAVRAMSVNFPCPEKLVEDKANGPAVIQTLKNEIPGLISSPINGGLLELATSMTGYVEAGNVYLPNPDLYPWVWDLIEQFAVFPHGKHDDDISAASHAWRRLFDSVSNTCVPEFRVTPRPGEPDTACHVEQDDKMGAALPPHWRRWIAVSPGRTGAALWVCETPSGSLRVYRELDLSNVDAHEAGRRIAEATLPDIRAYMSAVHLSAKWHVDVLLEKQAFAPIEPVGSYAELLERGLLDYDPTKGSWDERQAVKAEMKLAKFSSQMTEIEDASFDRLRDLLRFKPADYQELSYDRSKALSLRGDINAYMSYMASVEGRVLGEFPKLKFAASCDNTVRALGTARRGEDIDNSFLRALLIGIGAPASVMTQRPVKEVPWHAGMKSNVQQFRRRVG